MTDRAEEENFVKPKGIHNSFRAFLRIVLTSTTIWKFFEFGPKWLVLSKDILHKKMVKDTWIRIGVQYLTCVNRAEFHINISWILKHRMKTQPTYLNNLISILRYPEKNQTQQRQRKIQKNQKKNWKIIIKAYQRILSRRFTLNIILTLYYSDFHHRWSQKS